MEENAKESIKKDGESSDIPQSVQTELQTIYKWIDDLDRHSLVVKLKQQNQNPNGNVEILRKRLKNYFRRKKLSTVLYPNSNRIKTLFPYYVVLDFEATCNEINPPDFPHEIIEFPAVLVNTEKMAIVDQFQAFVKPVINPILTPFCKTLTGISQEQVDNAPEFPAVLEQFEEWLAKHKLGSKNKFAMVTDGPWDMGRFLYLQCISSGVSYPNFGKKWINLRKCFSQFYKCDRLRLQLMLEKLGMEFVGHPHCGLDDATNIAHLLIRMIQDGASIDVNEKIQLRYKLDQHNNENTANSSNQQAVTDKQRAAEVMANLKAEMKRHHIQADS